MSHNACRVRNQWLTTATDDMPNVETFAIDECTRKRVMCKRHKFAQSHGNARQCMACGQLWKIRRLQRLSSDTKEYNNAKHIFIDRLNNYDIPQYIIESINRFFPADRQQWFSATYRRMVLERQMKENHADNVWLPLPYHDA